MLEPLQQPEHRIPSPSMRATILLVMGAAILVAAIGLKTVVQSQSVVRKQQTLGLIVPYLSGAANHELGRGWRIDVNALDGVDELTLEEQRAKRWPKVDETVPFRVMAKGYLYVALIARTLFFWQGDLQAVESLQISIHILLTLSIISLLTSRRHQLLFFVGYGLNPLLLFFAMFPFYYYWQALPSAFLIPYLLNRDFRYGAWVVPIAGTLPFWFQIRPTTLFISIFLVTMMLRRETLKLMVGAIATAALFVLVCSDGSLNQNPWHTALIGLAAYPNDVVAGELGDRIGYDIFREETGIKLDLKLGGNYFDDEIYARFREVEKQRYLESAIQMPFRLVAHAALNFFQSYSVGYRVGNLKVSYASALIGAGFLGVLLWRRRWDFAICIGACSLAFVPYYPPVQVYMYGAYGLIIAAAISLTDDLPLWSTSSAVAAIPIIE
jgi:hypothetical protein